MCSLENSAISVKGKAGEKDLPAGPTETYMPGRVDGFGRPLLISLAR